MPKLLVETVAFVDMIEIAKFLQHLGPEMEKQENGCFDEKKLKNKSKHFQG